jgi:flagellar assembly protein FliH
MSSSVRRSRTLSAQPITWPLVSGNADHSGPAGSPDAHRGQPPAGTDPPVVRTEQEIESRVALVRQQAAAEGEAAGARIAAARLAPVIESLGSIIGELAAQRAGIRASAEEDTVKLAIAIARRVLNRELATDPGAILGLVKVAFSKLNLRETHRLRVAPADAAVIEEHRARLNLPSGLQTIADASLPAGSAVFETSRGELDASVDTQLAEIERGLADVLRRRTK